MNLITMVPTAASAGRFIARVPRADLDYLVRYEPDAYEHWLFNRGSENLMGLVDGRALTPAGAAPVSYDKYIKVKTAAGQQLNSTYDDIATAQDTVFMVMRHPEAGAGIHMHWGNFNTGSIGGAMFTSTASRSLYYGYGGVINSQVTGLSFPSRTAFYFTAVSRDFLNSTKTIRSMVGGQSIHNWASSAATTYVPGSGEKVNLGNKRYASVGSTDDDVVEFGIIPKFLSEADLTALYLRRKAELAKLGVTVV